MIITGRDAERCKRAADEMQTQAGAGTVRGEACDISSLEAVRRFAEEVRSSQSMLDALVLNAGTFEQKRVVTKEGFELTFAGRFLGHALLTELLLPSLVASGEGRVIITASTPRVFSIDFDDLQLERRYTLLKALNQALCALLLFELDLAKRHDGNGLTVNFMHPGYVDTGLFKDMPWLFRTAMRVVGSTPEEGADTIVWLATEPSLRGVTGGYFRNRRQHRFGGTLADRDKQVRVRKIFQELLSR